MSQVAMIALEHGEDRRKFALVGGSSLSEIRNMIHDTFGLEEDEHVVGVINVSTNVVYPLGIMVNEPILFKESVYKLLLA